eukprot:scaffold1338_cov63-Phaeocystis_antarctica.AAC.11
MCPASTRRDRWFPVGNGSQPDSRRRMFAPTDLSLRAGSRANVGDLGSLAAEPEGQLASTQPSGATERSVF